MLILVQCKKVSYLFVNRLNSRFVALRSARRIMSSSSTEPSPTVEVTEGRARVIFPNSNRVFYNPVQEFNRDLSIAVIKYYSEHLWNAKKAKRAKLKTGVQDDTSSITDPAKGSDMQPGGLGLGEDGPHQPTAVSGSESSHDRDGDKLGDNICGSEAAAEVTPVQPDQLLPLINDKPAHQEESGGLRILEALAASGLRSIRYGLEIPKAASVVANDISPEAFEAMKRNIAHNSVGDKVFPSCEDASMLMYSHRSPPNKRFDVVDLDPYGSPSQFLDSAIQAVADGGLLCVTCTDMSVLCGNTPETCHSKYGSISLKARYCHEMALRIVLSSLESHANRYYRYIVPLLSCSVDFYMRTFIQVFSSPSEVKRSSSKLSMVYHCIGCGSYHLQPLSKRVENGSMRKYPPSIGPPVGKLCEHCGSSFRLGGPIWSEPIHEPTFVAGLLEAVTASAQSYGTGDRIKGMLSVISEELHDVPLFHVLDELCVILHCDSLKMLALRSAIMDRGYRVSLSHTNANAVKTDAPHGVVWDIMRNWVKQHPVKNVKPDSPAATILSKEPQFETSFVVRSDANPTSRLLKLSRFPQNPEPNWGPKPRAKRKVSDSSEDIVMKRKMLQGKSLDSKEVSSSDSIMDV